MIIGSGAEARIERTESGVQKIRPVKSFRHPQLDMQLRKSRTRREAKVLARLAEHNIAAPRLRQIDDKNMIIDMEFLDAPQVRDVLTENNAQGIAEQIGLLIKCMHDAQVIHGDLTTSNMLFVHNTVYMIDFGLSFFSQDIEDQATDLHLLKQAVLAKHPNSTLWETIWEAYNPSEELSIRFEEVELRGRYKGKSA